MLGSGGGLGIPRRFTIRERRRNTKLDHLETELEGLRKDLEGLKGTAAEQQAPNDYRLGLDLDG